MIPKGFFPTTPTFSDWRELSRQHGVPSCHRRLDGDSFFQPFPAIHQLGISLFPLLKTCLFLFCDTEMFGQLMSGWEGKALL